MIAVETLEQLRLLRGMEFVAKVVGMQAILHTTRPTRRTMVDGLFAKECQDKFAGLLGETPETSAQAMAGLLACVEYDTRQSFQGLGGCVAISLEELLERAGVPMEPVPMQARDSMRG